MANLVGRAIANAQCSDCGKPVKIKVSKGSKAYYYCPHVSAETGEYCGNRKWWGVDASQKMQRDYLAARQSPKTEERGQRSETLERMAPAGHEDAPQSAESYNDDRRDLADLHDDQEFDEDGDGEFEDEQDDSGNEWSLYG